MITSKQLDLERRIARLAVHSGKATANELLLFLDAQQADGRRVSADLRARVARFAAGDGRTPAPPRRVGQMSRCRPTERHLRLADGRRALVGGVVVRSLAEFHAAAARPDYGMSGVTFEA